MTTEPSTTVLVADDHAATRRALRMLLEGETGLEVVAEAQDLPGALGLAMQHRPQVAVLDLSLQGA